MAIQTTTSFAPHSQIAQLSKLIATSIASLENACQDSQLPLPDLNSFGFEPQSEAFRAHPVAAESAKRAAAACLQLAAALMPPTDFVYLMLTGHYQTSAARVCIENHITEVLREAGPEGLHVNEIAAKTNLDRKKIGRILRYLTTLHLYREVKPDVFTNNRVSGAMDTGKSVEEILAEPELKYDNTGFPALCSHHVDINASVSPVALTVLKDQKLGFSEEPTEAAFCQGLKTDLSYYQFYQHPDNSFRRRRFGFAMKGQATLQPSDLILRAFDWCTIPCNSTVVDVGGGIGVATLPLAKAFPQFKLVIQDRPRVVEEANQYWSKELPEAITNGQVTFEAHDFFDPQPHTESSVFVVKQILHNWSPKYICKILSGLRKAASKDTVLLILDNVLPYSCRVSDQDETDDNLEQPLEQSDTRLAPKPLLPNYGALGNAAYTMDIAMMLHFNAQELTVNMLKDLLASTGWQLKKFRSVNPIEQFMQSVEAVPIPLYN